MLFVAAFVGILLFTQTRPLAKSDKATIVAGTKGGGAGPKIIVKARSRV
jgi:hypothetical protein